MKTIIIDDELASHKIIKQLIIEYAKNLNFAGSAYTIEEGIDLILEVQPDIIFLDIELPDGTGFDLLKRIKDKYSNFKIIFITGKGSLEYAMRAIQAEAQFYLEKPIDDELFEDAIKLIQEEDIQDNNAIIEAVLGIYQTRDLPITFAVRNGKRRIHKKVKDLVHLKADGKYTLLHFKDGAEILESRNIGKFIALFKPYGFFSQTRRSDFVNLHYVDSFILEGEGGMITLSNGNEVALSRLYKSSFRKDMDSF